MEFSAPALRLSSRLCNRNVHAESAARRHMNSSGKAQQIQTPLARELAARISTNGPITFSEYMEECLYNSKHGYYSSAKRTRFADYYTSVDVHPIFGRLLARQLQQMWQILDRPSEFVIVESGAG